MKMMLMKDHGPHRRICIRYEDNVDEGSRATQAHPYSTMKMMLMKNHMFNAGFILPPQHSTPILCKSLGNSPMDIKIKLNNEKFQQFSSLITL